MTRPLVSAVIDDQIYIAQDVDDLPSSESFRFFSPGESMIYHSLCDDFGPTSMRSVIIFVKDLDAQRSAHPESRIFVCVEAGKRNMTNAVFLLGAYMILKQDSTVQEVEDCFSWLDDAIVEPFRDATFSKPDFHLSLGDCWRALQRGKALGWIQVPHDSDDTWGKINIDEYAHYDNVLNGDFHEVVPGRFVAFKGPRDLGGGREYLDEHWHRRFSPSFYLEAFKDMGVSAVVRLNEPEYDGSIFTTNGIAFHDLQFEDCTAPPEHVVERFFQIVDKAAMDGGVVAVHCKAGLGRTGTLIALELMRTHGFGAREAIGWLRIMRPGSVIGEQQHFLCAREACGGAGPLAAAAGPGGGSEGHRSWPRGGSGGGGGSAVRLAVEVAAGVERRCGAAVARLRTT